MTIFPNIQAMQAIGLSRQIGANNVANIHTQEFQASRLTLETGPDGRGVHPQAIDPHPAPGPLVPGLGEHVEDGMRSTVWGMVEGSNTELVTEMVNSIRDERALHANVAMVRTWDEMSGAVLELRA